MLDRCSRGALSPRSDAARSPPTRRLSAATTARPLFVTCHTLLISTHVLIRSCGVALCLGGALTILINVVISPFMPASKDPALVMLSNVYLLRQSASGVAALLLLAGSIGLHLAQRPASGRLGTIAFLISFVGGCALFAVEFVDVFVLRAVAQVAPESVAALDKAPLLNIGFASAASLFALGWILLSIVAWKTKILPRRAAQATLAGLFLIPILQGTLGVAGAIVANLIFGGGLIGLGWALRRQTLKN